MFRGDTRGTCADHPCLLIQTICIYKHILQFTLEEYVRTLEDRVKIIDEGDGIRLNVLEEKVAALTAQNHLT